MKELLNKITSLDDETSIIAKALGFTIRCLGLGLGAGVFVGVVYALNKYAPLLIDKL